MYILDKVSETMNIYNSNIAPSFVDQLNVGTISIKMHISNTHVDMTCEFCSIEGFFSHE